MNDSEELKNKKQNVNDSEEKNKIKSEVKVNRKHRISPSNLENSKLFSTDKKNEIGTYKKINSERHFSPNFNHKKRENYINEKKCKEEVEKEIQKRKGIYNKFKSLYSKMKIDRFLEEESSNEYDEYFDSEITSFKKENSFYYIINKTWFNQFKNYCLRYELTYSKINEDYPGQINNQHLILKDDKCLKLLSDNRIIINSKFLDNCVCINEEFVEEDLKLNLILIK